MKKGIYLLLAMPLLFTSCSKDENLVSEETVQVSFSTELPKRIDTRSATTDLNVNKVVCAVFENDTEISVLRKVIDIEEEKEIVFAPSLIKGRTYDVVFWAMKDDNYKVDDMTAIVRSENTVPESDFDAFTESVQITVNSSTAETVTLKRPLAQLNIGVTQDDWTTVTKNFNMTPTTMEITVTGKNTFNALAGKATGEDKSITYSLSCSGEDMTVENTTYKNIASCYILPEEQKENFDFTYTIKDLNSTDICSNVTINSVPLSANYKTNVVGGLLTGTVTYTISIEKSFNEKEHNKKIE